MREIKFRAWDKGEQDEEGNWIRIPAILKVVAWEKTTNDYYSVTCDSLEFTQTGKRCDVPIYRICLCSPPIMQYTGLKDKRNKEIYEGDIIVKQCYLWFDKGKPNYRGTVEWIFSEWQVVAHCINSEKRGISDGVNEGINDNGVDEGEKSDWEVIGNIYENPELLKKA